jgi:hypothetical protein
MAFSEAFVVNAGCLYGFFPAPHLFIHQTDGLSGFIRRPNLS